MAHTIPVTFDLDPETAAALEDPMTRSRVALLIGRSAHSSIPGEPNAALGDLIGRFRAFAAAHRLDGLDPQTLISEGRR